MADGNGQRHRFGAVVFGLVVAAAVLAVFPATAPLGMTLCLLLLIPAMVAVWRTRRAPVGTRRRSVVALVVAPVFLLVGAGVMPHPPVTASVVEAAPAAASVAGPTTPASLPAVVAEPVSVVAAPPTTVAPVPAVVAPAPVAAALVAAPARPVQTVAPKPAPRPATAKPAPRPVAAKPAAPAPVAGSSCGAASYVNSSGNCVLRPVAAPSAPAGASAQCKDGTYSFSQHRSGTCSGHGGVSRWL